MLNKEFVCAPCGTDISSSVAFIKHNIKVHRIVDFQCPTCNKKFVLRSSYLRHLKNGHQQKEIPNYFCCDKKFVSYNAFRYHYEAKHSEIKN